jgi:hypothetical protein
VTKQRKTIEVLRDGGSGGYACGSILEHLRQQLRSGLQYLVITRTLIQAVRRQWQFAATESDSASVGPIGHFLLICSGVHCATVGTNYFMKLCCLNCSFDFPDAFLRRPQYIPKYGNKTILIIFDQFHKIEEQIESSI